MKFRGIDSFDGCHEAPEDEANHQPMQKIVTQANPFID